MIYVDLWFFFLLLILEVVVYFSLGFLSVWVHIPSKKTPDLNNLRFCDVEAISASILSFCDLCLGLGYEAIILLTWLVFKFAHI